VTNDKQSINREKKGYSSKIIAINAKITEKIEAKTVRKLSLRYLDESKKLDITRLQPEIPKTIKIKRFSFKLELGKNGLPCINIVNPIS
jgi:hypothetical protein